MNVESPFRSSAEKPVRDDPDLPRVSPVVDGLLPRIRAFRRDIHQHPELSLEEHRTTAKILELLNSAGLEPQQMESTGAWVDIGQGPIVLGLRADIDALPLQERTGLDYASVHDGIAHACGHDMHTAVMAGTALSLQQILSGQSVLHTSGLELNGRVRIIFQPAEERLPGGALQVMKAGLLDEVPRILAAHCDPAFDVGTIGTRIGAITSATDTLRITVTGHGGHTSRPQQTEDVVYALSKIASEVPAVLSRLVDVRSAVQVVWGHISAGAAPNAIPSIGQLSGTLRCLDADAWGAAADLLDQVIRQIAAPYGVAVEIDHVRGVPPVVSTEKETDLIEDATRFEIGSRAITLTPQSMGGEDFAWMTQKISGAMFRLGTRTPDGPIYDLHQGDFNPDERALGVGVKIFTAAALRALAGVQ
ncbi:amidohydrolase [Auritidibacter sp. NML130574]|uniref:amidohydrolase n=1 Tax=Auritidibacter sp. NML130574 TaxID=2170745 RepID=UPI000D735E9C|nr:amidohydrolase [Auritidibacter sp. NML130574]AXR75097.1 amidohydrolase [Auritidibacter sp. NML130574]